ncbi:type IV pilin-like G/H family protein [Laspinema olomoucense]|uniref:type IV pilin-like G/H family protein n=1 Tax=Laspinema olomoucense TaxID=3231600 RepID=UPI0021BAA29E|nr:type IV pilin-like G/H family protein [Laspinema sp. D3d]MCT7974384.1 type IV pilin-like G/H family protein [Laspinema sp. D3d]
MSDPTSKQNDSNWGKGLGYLIGLCLLGVLLICFLSIDSFLVNRAKSRESRTQVGAMNRGQQAYFVEHNTFAQSLEALQMGIHSESRTYRYSTKSLDHAAFQYGISLHPEVFNRKPGDILEIFPRRGKEYALPSYLGVVWVKPHPTADSDEMKSDIDLFSILCESTYPYVLEEGFQPGFHNGDFHCPQGMKVVN